jgi:hypothetical protein
MSAGSLQQIFDLHARGILSMGAVLNAAKDLVLVRASFFIEIVDTIYESSRSLFDLYAEPVPNLLIGPHGLRLLWEAIDAVYSHVAENMTDLGAKEVKILWEFSDLSVAMSKGIRFLRYSIDRSLWDPPVFRTFRASLKASEPHLKVRIISLTLHCLIHTQ